jgi:hypothetical protein
MLPHLLQCGGAGRDLFCFDPGISDGLLGIGFDLRQPDLVHAGLRALTAQRVAPRFE